MGMHEDWKNAKKESEENFKEAYDNWVSEQVPKAKKGDPKAKKIVLEDALKQAGLDKGSKYTNYFNFDEGFGKQLDNLEKLMAEKEVNLKKVPSLKLGETCSRTKR